MSDTPKRVLITGASRGIGSACARRFASAGSSVIINYKNSEKEALSLASECLSLGARSVDTVKADVSKSDEISRLIKASEAIGGIDTLVLNAGVASYGLFQDVSEQEYDRVMDTNVRGAFLVAKAFIPQMISKKSGSIVTVSSMWGEVGGSCEVIYSMSKASLIGMTKALAKELGPSGIRVNCVSPGVVETDMTRSLGSEVLESLAADTPLCRNATDVDIANAVYFLASDSSSFITGQILGVNGGLFT
ncbi:MAG: 3-oxoacyl-ACP reductase FabG [Clostridia bacterium]|nr:3-oxoacyl-ACP reductase FabG [Clostridia bacterium]